MNSITALHLPGRHHGISETSRSLQPARKRTRS
jgi:hypothetical protein